MRLEDGSEGGGDVGNTGAVPGDLACGGGGFVESLQGGDAQGVRGVVRGEEGRCARGALCERRAGRDQSEENGGEGDEVASFVERGDESGAEAGGVQPDAVQVGHGGARG